LRRAGTRLTQSETPLLDARILLKQILRTDDAGLIARGGEAMAPAALAEYELLLARRAEGEPVAYITGIKEFWSLEFKVTPDVLIPRDDTGALIETVLRRRGRAEKLRIADLGAGSGAILCALLHEFPGASGVGVDISSAACSVATENAARLGLSNRAVFIEGAWAAPLEGPFDVIVSNPPYIPDGDRARLARDVVDFEPAGALFAGADGLDAYRALLPGATQRLAPDGLVLLECGADQTDSLAALLVAHAPSEAPFTMFDLAGRPRGVGFDRRLGQKRD